MSPAICSAKNGRPACLLSPLIRELEVTLPLFCSQMDTGKENLKYAVTVVIQFYGPRLWLWHACSEKGVKQVEENSPAEPKKKKKKSSV